MALSLGLLCRNYQYCQRPPWTHSFAAVLSPAGARTGFTRWANRGADWLRSAKTMQGYITASIEVQTQPLTSAASSQRPLNRASYKPAAASTTGLIKSAKVTTFYRAELAGTSSRYIDWLYQRSSPIPLW